MRCAAAADRCTGLSATTWASPRPRSCSTSSRAARRGSRSKRACGERMSSSSSRAEAKVRSLPAARTHAQPHACQRHKLTSRVACSQRPFDGVRTSSWPSCVKYLTVSQTPHHHLGLSHGLCKAHHRRAAPLPLLAPVRHPLQQDGRAPRQSPGLALKNRHIHLRLAPADAAPRPARERGHDQWRRRAAPPAQQDEGRRAQRRRPDVESPRQPDQAQRHQAQRHGQVGQEPLLQRRVRLRRRARHQRPIATVDYEAAGL
jgi:hypothetical protein